MKIRILILAQFFAFISIAQITPRISSVKVFSSGAEISREENIKVKSGIDTLKITGLSPFLRQQTIQAKINGVKILDIDFKISHLNNTKDEPKLAQVKSQIKQVERDLLNLGDELAYLEIEYDLVLSNKKINDKGVLDVDDLKDFVFYYKNNLPILIRKITDQKEQINKFREVLSKLKKEEKELQRVKSEKTGQLEILYKAPQNRQTKLELSYHVYNCGWSPLYNLRASNIGEPVNFEYNALIYQNTGINWEKCNLTIATGNPVLGGNKPELYAWGLNDQGYRKYGYAEYDADYRLQNKEVAEVISQEEISYAAKANRSISKSKQVVRTENLTFSSFEIPQKFSLNTGAGEKSVNIMKRELPASYQYYAVPKKSNGVFLLAQVTEWEKMPLIPGKSHIYFDETFVGKSYINPNTMSDTLDVSLGQDQSILVERKKLEDKCMNKTNIMGVTKTRGYEITVKNNRDKAINIQIVDQIPISKNSKIKVDHKLGDGWVLKEETGILEWNLEVPAGDKKSTSFEFEVKHPKKFNVPL